MTLDHSEGKIPLSRRTWEWPALMFLFALSSRPLEATTAGKVRFSSQPQCICSAVSSNLLPFFRHLLHQGSSTRLCKYNRSRGQHAPHVTTIMAPYRSNFC